MTAGLMHFWWIICIKIKPSYFKLKQIKEIYFPWYVSTSLGSVIFYLYCLKDLNQLSRHFQTGYWKYFDCKTFSSKVYYFFLDKAAIFVSGLFFISEMIAFLNCILTWISDDEFMKKISRKQLGSFREEAADICYTSRFFFRWRYKYYFDRRVLCGEYFNQIKTISERKIKALSLKKWNLLKVSRKET